MAVDKNSPPPSPAPGGAKEDLRLSAWRAWSRWRLLLAGGLIGLSVFVAALAGVLMAYSQDLPVVPGPDNLTPSLATKIYDINGQLITQLAVENRTLVHLDQVPKNLVNAIIALEDRRFMSHWGVDPWGILRAAAVNLKAGRTIEGGSTLTQQLAKNLFLTREKKFSRKIKEALLSLQIERRFTKQEILEMYFNQVYFGNGAYGVEAAARTYFGKHASELSLSECALLAGIPRSPNKNNPIDDLKQATYRRDTALSSMLEVGSITKEEHDAALAEPVAVFQADPVVAAYFVDMVRQQLETTYGTNAVYKGGLSVYTTLDLRMQDLAQRASEKGAHDADIKAAPFLEHDFRLTEKPVLQVAFLAMDPRTGHIRAMVGGRDFKRYQFNRATQASRQPGSSFKPFVYTAAIEAGFTPADIIDDSPVVYRDAHGADWKPENFDKEFKGPVTLRRALYESRNVVTVKLLEKIGAGVAANMALRMGITTKLNRDLSMGLGTSEVTLLEMVNAYCTLANQGVHVEPVSILSVRDAAGKLLEEAQPHATEALSPAVAYVVTSMLQDVIDRGTASTLRTTQHFTRIAAGKTGTTSDFSDAWFLGYTPDLVAGCWFGYDQRRRIGKLLTGGLIAAPVWAEFMDGALAGVPDKPFPVPQGVKFSRLCADTGKPPDSNCKRVIDEAFVEGSEAVAVDGAEDGNHDLQKFYDGDIQGGAAAATGTASPVPGAAAAAPASSRPVTNTSTDYPADGSMGF
jgi:penicillin-binding protein 1A